MKIIQDCSILQHNLDIISNWCRQNYLKLKRSKFVCFFSRKLIDYEIKSVGLQITDSEVAQQKKKMFKRLFFDRYFPQM